MLSIYFIEKNIGWIKKQSAIYLTEAWGNKDQPDFFNIALEVQTQLKPPDVLNKIRRIEGKMGRQRYIKWGPRLIDIDILFYNDQVIDDADLTIPHPQLEQRNFVLAPLCEIAPNLIHPILNKSIEELYINSSDPLEVKKLDA